VAGEVSAHLTPTAGLGLEYKSNRRKSYTRTLSTFSLALESKLGDIDKVHTALAQKGVTFRPPLPPVVPLLRMATFVSSWGLGLQKPYITSATAHTVLPVSEFKLLARCTHLVAGSLHPSSSGDAAFSTWSSQSTQKACSVITACERIVSSCATACFGALQLASALRAESDARDGRAGATHRAAARSMRSAAEQLMQCAHDCVAPIALVLSRCSDVDFGALRSPGRLVPWLRACCLSVPLPLVDESTSQADEQRALRAGCAAGLLFQLRCLLDLLPASAVGAASLSAVFSIPAIMRRQLPDSPALKYTKSALQAAVAALPLASLDVSSGHLGNMALPQRGMTCLDTAVQCASEAGVRCSLVGATPDRRPAAVPLPVPRGGSAVGSSASSEGWLSRWWQGQETIQPEAIAPGPTASGSGAPRGDHCAAEMGAHPSDVWPWWLFALGNLLDNIAQSGVKTMVQRPDSRRELELFLVFAARCVPMIPGEFWTSGNPTVWRRSGARQLAAGMPVLLARQLRLLCEPSFMASLAAVCMQPGPLTVPRLLLDNTDEGDTAALGASGTAGAGAAAGSSGSQSWWGKLFGQKRSRDRPRVQEASASPPDSGNFAEWLQSSRLARWLGSKKAGGRGGGAAAGEAASGEERESLLGDSWGGGAVELAPGGGADDPTPPQCWPGPLALRFCALYSALLARASGMGRTGVYSSSVFSEHSLLSARRILNTLAFDSRLALVRRLWQAAVQAAAEANEGKEDALHEDVLPSQAYAACCTLVDASRAATGAGSMVFLSLLAPLLRHLLVVLDDLELYQGSTPLPMRELRYLVRAFKFWLARAYGFEVGIFSSKDAQRLSQAPPSVFWLGVERSIVGSLAAMYDRHTRRPLGVADMFTLPMEGGASAWGGQSNVSIALRLVHLLPCAVPFEQRLKWFHDARLVHHGENRALPALALPVRREAIFDMAFARLSTMEPSQLHRKLHVQFTNEHGLSEAGIDAGGLFKELWTELAAVVFNHGYGLFRVTPTSQLYPNSQAAMAVGVADDTPLFRFVGRVLGKAVYEGVVVQPQFAPFTLAKLLGKPVNLHYLPSLDADLYKNLMFLKTYEGDARDLCLSFTLPGDDGDMSHRGATHGEMPLIPGGGDVEVTNSNKIRYIHMVADAKLNRAMSKQTAALVAGFHEVIPPAWLSSFSEPELQTLLSGAAGDIDIDDLQAHTRYAGGYFSTSSTIKALWKALRALPEEDKAAFLRFVTACERPPPLGFRDLDPPFTIQRVGDTSRLPSASTCFNILKLGDFGSEAVVREKLLYAIRSGAGFELS